MLDRATLPLVGRGDRAAQGAEPLTAQSLTTELPGLMRSLRLVPDYDAQFAAWLLSEVATVTLRGELRARLVRTNGGTTLGYYVYYLVSGGLSPVIAVAAPDEEATGAVLDAMISDARSGGAATLHGRLEPRLLRPLSQRRALLRYGGGALVHSPDPANVGLAVSRHALLTRLEGEWWMGPHLGSSPARRPAA
jgi:hypothetical protein